MSRPAANSIAECKQTLRYMRNAPQLWTTKAERIHEGFRQGLTDRRVLLSRHGPRVLQAVFFDYSLQLSDLGRAHGKGF